MPDAPALTGDLIAAAADRLAGRVRTTPVVEVEPAAFGTPGPVRLKLELLQHTGSFKPRGAFNRVLSAGGRAQALVAASGGNHGLAVAYVGQQLGLPTDVFVPLTVPAVKVARLRGLGATVHLAGASYAEALAASTVHAAESGALVVHAYDQLEVTAGQGTVGRELAAQAPDVDTVLVAVGGGGLIAGVATALAGRARVVAVETEGAPTMYAALAAGQPVDVEVGGVAADSLGARRVGEIAFAVASRLRLTTLLVADDAVRDARRRLWDELRVAAEPGGAAALAALTSGAYRPAAGERVAVVVCGGNTDPVDLVDR